MMLGKLVPCGGGLPLPLLKSTLLLGRKPECDVTVPCSSVSGRHCLLEFEDGSWWVRDLESKNGTAVNGHRGGRQRIAPNDILSVGRQRLVVDYQPARKSVVTAPVHDPDEDLAFEFLKSDEGVSPNVPVSPASSAPESSPTSALAAARPTLRATASADLGKLVPCGGGAPIPLRYPELVLGRSPECDVRVRFPSVSSRHCKLSFDDGYWLVEDLNSTNGTWVDGDRCLMQCLLPESVLALDKHRFTIHYLPRSNGPPPAVRRPFSQSLLEKAGLANEFAGDRLGGRLLPDDDLDRPKRYNLLEPDDE